MQSLPVEKLFAAVQPTEPGEEIPVLDLAPMLEGEPGALARLARQLCGACERVGFHFVINHGVPRDLVSRMFAQAVRFHAQPLDAKLAIRINDSRVGYLPMESGMTRNATITGIVKPNLNESFFMRNELAPDDPTLRVGEPLRGLNQWPHDLPGFRETACEYFDALDRLGHRMLPLYAVALGLEPDRFDQAFQPDRSTLRLAHYPARPLADGQFGSAPHTDGGFITLLAQETVPGLHVFTRSGKWIPAPVVNDAFLVNSGDLLARWSNDRFVSTPHRVIHAETTDRYSIPFFFNPALDATIECLPSCCGPDNPPRYAPTTYSRYYNETRFQSVGERR